LIGIGKTELAKALKVIPDFHPMGTGGMADMGSMEMPMPDNTLPMMTGFGQFGPLDIGRMFTVLKVREGLGANDYRDPGDYRNPVENGRARGPGRSRPAGPPARPPRDRTQPKNGW
jgi:hypothetical protein